MRGKNEHNLSKPTVTYFLINTKTSATDHRIATYCMQNMLTDVTKLEPLLTTVAVTVPCRCKPTTKNRNIAAFAANVTANAPSLRRMSKAYRTHNNDF